MKNPLNTKQIIVTPVYSEKSVAESVYNRYVFKVDQRANKHQIKLAVEKLFKVDVVKVRTLIAKSKKQKSLKTGKTKTVKGYKKAIVQIKPKQKIDLFSNLK